MLKNDKEYVARVGKHLSKEVMWKWWESEMSGWSNFYLFLGNTAKTAKKQLTSDSIMSALSGDKGDKIKCSSCYKLPPESALKSRTLQHLTKGTGSYVLCVTSLHTNIKLKLVEKEYLKGSRTVLPSKQKMMTRSKL